VTDLRDSRARRLASFASLLFAAVATLGTSASPPPPPAMSDDAKGTLVVTPDEPVATVDVTVTANAAVQAAPGSFTRVQIRAGAFTAGASGASGAITTIEAREVEAQTNSTPVNIGVLPQIGVTIDKACGPADCVRHFRITTVLVDPTLKEARVDWVATIESRFGASGATGSAPPDGRLDIAAGEINTVTKASIVQAEARTKPIRLDGTHPRTVVTLDVLRPPDGAVRSLGPLLVLELAGDTSLGSSDAPVQVAGVLGDVTVFGGYLRPTPEVMATNLPPGCDDPGGCRSKLALTFTRQPRAPETLDISWTLRGVAIAPEGGAAGPLSLGEPTTTTVSFEQPDLVARATGTATIGQGANVRLRGVVTLDETAVAQGGPHVSGFLRATLTITTPSVAGAPTDALGLSVDGSYGNSGPTGREVSASGQLHELTCGGRSRCDATIDAGAGLKAGVPGTVVATWTLEVQFVAADGVVVPPGAQLLVAATPVTN
jgi:hypothetical protein